MYLDVNIMNYVSVAFIFVILDWSDAPDNLVADTPVNASVE
jgi:hypothetical protein